jgi:hypothetical protein
MLPRQRRSLSAGCGCGGSQSEQPKLRNGWEITASALSIGVWVLMPKCPVCLAAHVALWTGLGLSFGTAQSIRRALLWLSGALLIYLVVRKVRALRRAESTPAS